MMTEEDHKLLKLIGQDCRLTPLELSVQTGLTPQYIGQRITAWEKEKVIVCYQPMINWARTGEEKVSALIEVRVLPQRGYGCLLYTSDAADEEDSVDLGGRRIIKKNKQRKKR